MSDNINFETLEIEAEKHQAEQDEKFREYLASFGGESEGLKNILAKAGDQIEAEHDAAEEAEEEQAMKEAAAKVAREYREKHGVHKRTETEADKAYVNLLKQLV